MSHFPALSGYTWCCFSNLFLCFHTRAQYTLQYFVFTKWVTFSKMIVMFALLVLEESNTTVQHFLLLFLVLRRARRSLGSAVAERQQSTPPAVVARRPTLTSYLHLPITYTYLLLTLTSYLHLPLTYTCLLPTLSYTYFPLTYLLLHYSWFCQRTLV